MKRLLACVFGMLLLGESPARGQLLPTELEDCVGVGADFCSDSTAVLVDEGCGQTFYRYRGRIAWSALRNVGPVTISVLTRAVPVWNTSFPLYVEVRGRTNPGDGTDCLTGLGGHLVLVAQGGTLCGGTWESAGPIDLAPYGVPLGANYNLQCIFFEALPHWIPGFEPHSIGFSCIRVTSHPTGVDSRTWGLVKSLYRDATR